MEQTVVPKRPREEQVQQQQEEVEVNSEEPSKRHKPYSHILSLLESEEEEPTQDLSPLITTLQQEISCSASNSETPLAPLTQHEDCQPQNSTSSQESVNADEEGDEERVMRRLLEASDDELGIPNTGGDMGWFDYGEDGFSSNGGGDYGFASLCDGLWELEDETANYYTLLQSELFL